MLSPERFLSPERTWKKLWIPLEIPHIGDALFANINRATALFVKNCLLSDESAIPTTAPNEMDAPAHVTSADFISAIIDYWLSEEEALPAKSDTKNETSPEKSPNKRKKPKPEKKIQMMMNLKKM